MLLLQEGIGGGYKYLVSMKLRKKVKIAERPAICYLVRK